MTTARFATLTSPTARAMAAVKGQHCPPPTYRPTQAVAGSIACPKCGGRLNYTVAPTGISSGRCSSINCVRWTD